MQRVGRLGGGGWGGGGCNVKYQNIYILPICMMYGAVYYFISEVCRENIKRCNGNSCTCKPGYEPDDCCCPTGQKLDQNRNCICKVTEEPPVNGVCPGRFACNI